MKIKGQNILADGTIQPLELNFKEADELLFKDYQNFLYYLELADNSIDDPLDYFLYVRKALTYVSDIPNMEFADKKAMYDCFENFAVIAKDVLSKYQAKEVNDYSITVNGITYQISNDEAMRKAGKKSFRFDDSVEVLYNDSVADTWVEEEDTAKKYLAYTKAKFNSFAILVKKKGETIPDTPERFRLFLDERSAIFENVLTVADIQDARFFFINILTKSQQKQSMQSSLRSLAVWQMESLAKQILSEAK